jgi:hypothetical protein
VMSSDLENLSFPLSEMRSPRTFKAPNVAFVAVLEPLIHGCSYT